jgi:RND family efflux transporter MFP subunit
MSLSSQGVGVRGPRVWRRVLSMAALVAVVVCLNACNKGGAAQAGGPGDFALKVKLAEAQAKPVNETTEYVATIKSRTSAVLQPQVEGQITRIFAKSGDAVRAGQAILQIDPVKQTATVNSQEATRKLKLANRDLARTQWERARQLHAAGVISKQDLDQAEAAFAAAQADASSLDAQVREQEAQLKYYSVTAPFDGVVGDIPVHVGDRVTTSTMLTTVDQRTGLEAYINVPTERAPLLRIGMPVQVLDALGKVVAETRVTFIAPQVDTATQSVLVKATVDQAREALRAAQFVRAQIVWNTAPRVTVPVTAVSRTSGQYFAYVAEAGEKGGLVARQRAVKLGAIVGNDYVVMDGLRPGDKVVVSGAQNLADGMSITAGS